MWIVIHMAENTAAAERARTCLEEEGVLVRLRPVYRKAATEENCFEIQVLQSEAEEARAILLERGQ